MPISIKINGISWNAELIAAKTVDEFIKSPASIPGLDAKANEAALRQVYQACKDAVTPKPADKKPASKGATAPEAGN